mmetsp:Transcript_12410/g.40561  ORF Transcript_12410/g.40561 Transcript_12410/m.40561 type:complete len:484 (-) Transcript_12410:251-1702(-)
MLVDGLGRLRPLPLLGRRLRVFRSVARWLAPQVLALSLLVSTPMLAPLPASRPLLFVEGPHHGQQTSVPLAQVVSPAKLFEGWRELDLFRGKPRTSFVAEVAEKVGPSVVCVEVRSDQSLARGSGVIFSKDTILTNAHLMLGGGGDVRVVRGDSVYEASLVGKDVVTDLALLRCRGADFSDDIADFGDDQTLRVGDWVIAIGHPMGLDNTVTLGIVSSLRRSIEGSSLRNRYVQTDAAINPGNSGGPLCDERGKVIGITTSAALNAQSIGFAIPASRAVPIAETLLAKGKVEHSFIGLNVRTEAGGLAVVRVVPASPAFEAGFRVNDLIVQVDGRVVNSVTALFDLVDSKPVGASIDFLVQREDDDTKSSKFHRLTVVTDDLHNFLIDPATNNEEPPPPQSTPSPPVEDPVEAPEGKADESSGGSNAREAPEAPEAAPTEAAPGVVPDDEEANSASSGGGGESRIVPYEEEGPPSSLAPPLVK